MPTVPPRLRPLHLALLLVAPPLAAQERPPDADSAFVERVERVTRSPKVYHAEPIAIDLMRDLGARRGEAEWNVGLGMTDKLRYDEYLLFVEYEFAPRDRLGLEIELPVRLHTALDRSAEVPRNQLESLKLAGMWTAAVDTARHWSAAVGYLHEVLLADTRAVLLRRPVDGQVFNPFLVGAKRWGDSWHTMLYAGPRLVRGRDGRWQSPRVELNWSGHYMVPGTRNLVGLEVNQAIETGRSDYVVRPQLRLAVNDHLLVGIAAGVPLRRERERVGTFVRLIYEPRSGNERRPHG